MLKLDTSKIRKQYEELKSKYEKLGFNLTQALELLLIENDIPTISISYRIKETDSFIEKIERKHYENPFIETEDICGIRIVCYYQSDVDLIGKIIAKELTTFNEDNKIDQFEFDRFGYRSLHFITKIKDNWLSTPNYRGLENLKCEIQVRTVLMHAWAEIEHKLAYKSTAQIPNEIRRKLSRISAKLEESDEQFEEIKNNIEKNQKKLLDFSQISNKFNSNIEFNLDNLQAFLDYAFPERIKNIKTTRSLFNDMIQEKIDLQMLVTGFEKSKSILKEVEFEGAKEFYGERIKVTKNELYWIQVGAARTVLRLTHNSYFKKHTFDDEITLIERYRNRLNN